MFIVSYGLACSEYNLRLHYSNYISKAWCKTILTTFILICSCNRFALSPRYGVVVYMWHLCDFIHVVGRNHYVVGTMYYVMSLLCGGNDMETRYFVVISRYLSRDNKIHHGKEMSWDRDIMSRRWGNMSWRSRYCVVGRSYNVAGTTYLSRENDILKSWDRAIISLERDIMSWERDTMSFERTIVSWELDISSWHRDIMELRYDAVARK